MGPKAGRSQGVRGGSGAAIIGRATELAEVAGLLATVPLVTLVGPPGVGKSRIAGELCAQQGGRARRVDLGGVASETAAREALGLGDWPSGLLVVDNADQWVAVAAEAVAGLLDRHLDLAVLVTSRERLGLPEEVVHPIGPLDASAAVALFRQRAQAARPGVELDAGSEATIARICRDLDGLPLAIELAAGRLAVLSPDQIASGMHDRFRLLRAGSRSPVARHRSMEAALDLSHDALSDGERGLLWRLAAFPGGCTLEAAQHVCRATGTDERDVLDLLDQLAGRSLLVVDVPGTVARYRLLETVRAHALARADAAGVAVEILDAFAAWCGALARQGEKGLAGADEPAWSALLDAESPNLAFGLRWLLHRGDDEAAVRLAVALPGFWRLARVTEGKNTLFSLVDTAKSVAPGLRARLLYGLGLLALVEGRYGPAVKPITDALVLAREAEDAETWARCLLLLGNCAIVLQGAEQGLPMVQQSLALARQVDDHRTCTSALALCAWAHHLRGDPPSAVSLAEEAVAVARQHGQVSGLAAALAMLGYVATRAGDLAAARMALSDAWSAATRLHWPSGKAMVLSGLGDLELAAGRWDEAAHLLGQAVEAARASGVVSDGLQPLYLLGKLAESHGDEEQAAARFRDVLALGKQVGFTSVEARQGLRRAEARPGDDPDETRRRVDDLLAEARKVGSKSVTADALHDLGELARASGRYGHALSMHRRALKLREELADGAAIADSLEALAGVNLEEARFDRAARLYGAADGVRRSTGVEKVARRRPGRDDDLLRIEKALGGRFPDEYSIGGQLSAGDAVAAAMSRRPSWRPATGWGSLTPAERDVVALVADGLTNQQVAERLVISRRTVQTHLTHVFAKLGIRSRTELASMAAAIES